MRVLAADPGPSKCGVCIVDVTDDGRLHVVEALWRPFALARSEDRAWWSARVREALTAPGSGLVAVEQVLHAYGDTPDGALIDTKDVEAALVTLAFEAGASGQQVARIPAVSWRADLTIRPPRTDDQVAVAVEWMYGAAALADLDADARCHAYDALGLAAVAVARRLGRRIVVPAAVATRIHELWQTAKARNKARKAEKAAAEPVRRVLAGAGAATVALVDVVRATGLPPDAVIAALKVLSKARGPEAAAARRTMVAAGLRKPDAGPQTAQARRRRSGAATRGWRQRRAA